MTETNSLLSESNENLKINDKELDNSKMVDQKFVSKKSHKNKFDTKNLVKNFLNAFLSFI